MCVRFEYIFSDQTISKQSDFTNQVFPNNFLKNLIVFILRNKYLIKLYEHI